MSSERTTCCLGAFCVAVITFHRGSFSWCAASSSTCQPVFIDRGCSGKRGQPSNFGQSTASLSDSQEIVSVGAGIRQNIFPHLFSQNSWKVSCIFLALKAHRCGVFVSTLPRDLSSLWKWRLDFVWEFLLLKLILHTNTSIYSKTNL